MIDINFVPLGLIPIMVHGEIDVEAKYNSIIAESEENKHRQSEFYKERLNLLLEKCPALPDNGPIVSITSFGDRLKYIAHYAIETIFLGTLLPRKIVLNIHKEDEKNISDELRQLQKKGLEINIHEKDLKVYFKLLPTIKKYPDDIIITIDDDILYPQRLLEMLILEYQKHPQKIISFHNELFFPDHTGNVDWHYDISEYEKDSRVGAASSYIKENQELPDYHARAMPMGIHGVLYYPGCFPEEAFEDEIYLDIAKTNDDMWFWAMAIIKRIENKGSVKDAYFDPPVQIIDNPPILNLDKERRKDYPLITFTLPENKKKIELRNENCMYIANKNNQSIIFKALLKNYPILKEYISNFIRMKFIKLIPQAFLSREVFCEINNPIEYKIKYERCVVFVASANYLKYALVAACSFIEHHDNFTLAIITDNEDIRITKALLEISKNKNIEIKIIENIDKICNNYYIQQWKYFSRCIIPYIIKAKQILYLDCDTLTLANIDNIFDNKNLAVSTIIDEVTQKYQNYFNSGVIMFNVDEVRRLYNFKEILNKIWKFKDNEHHDQDLLNECFKDNNCIIDRSYNWLTKYFSDDIGNMNEAKILHYAGDAPWKFTKPGFYWSGKLAYKWEQKRNDYENSYCN